MRRKIAFLLAVVTALSAVFVVRAESETPVCHRTGHKPDGAWMAISISWQGWVNGHRNHGDFIINSDNPCPPQDNNNPSPDPTQDPPPVIDPPIIVDPHEWEYTLNLPVIMFDDWYCQSTYCNGNGN